MADERSDRLVPERLLKQFLRAAAAEIGMYSLLLMLRNAGLERWIDRDRLAEEILPMRASQFAALQAAMRLYFGRGARGSLSRIGRKTWLGLEEQAPFGWKMRRWLRRLLPSSRRARLVLEDLARQMNGSDGRISVHLLDIELYLIDPTSDATFAQRADQPICWMTLGMIEGALIQETGLEYDIEETACRALGAEACEFRIRK